MKEIINLPKPKPVKRSKKSIRHLSTAKLFFYLSTAGILITILLSLLFKSQIEEFRALNALVTKTNRMFTVQMEEKFPGSVEVIDVKAQSPAANVNTVSLRLDTVNATVESFVPNQEMISIGACKNRKYNTDNEVCVDIAKETPIKSGELLGKLTLRWGTPGTARLSTGAGNAYANSNSLTKSDFVNAVFRVQSILPETGATSRLNLWTVAGGVALLFCLVVAVITIKSGSKFNQTQLDRQWKLIAMALLCSLALLIFGVQQGRNLINLPFTGVDAPAAADPDAGGGLMCGGYGCAEGGLTGIEADKVCENWGPDNATTKYECKEGRVDPVSGKKGLCSVVAANFCPGKTIDPNNPCGCVDGSTSVSCGLIDVNIDGKLDPVDLAAFAMVYNRSCSDTAPTTGCGGKDTDKNGKIDYVDLASFAIRYHSVASSCLL